MSALKRIINKDMNRVEYDKLNINSIGLYFGEINRGSLRLTIEGSQIIGPFAKKGIIELNEKHTKQWMAGEDIELDEDYPVEFYIIKNKLGDFLSSGKVKEKKLLNYVPKERRV